MRIVENIEKVVLTEQLVGVVCNCCGKALETNELNSVQKINLSFGYGSEFDTQEWGVDLCENCIKNITKQFKVVPDKFMSNPFFTSSFDLDHDLHQEMFNKWKINEEWDDTYDEEELYQGYIEFIESQLRKPADSNTFKIVK
jgi:hypothetical protein